jgi:hypothetical protein
LCSFSKSLEKVRCFSKDCTYITLNFAEITDLITENKNLNRTIIENNKFVCGVYIQLYKDIESIKRYEKQEYIKKLRDMIINDTKENYNNIFDIELEGDDESEIEDFENFVYMKENKNIDEFSFTDFINFSLFNVKPKKLETEDVIKGDFTSRSFPYYIENYVWKIVLKSWGLKNEHDFFMVNIENCDTANKLNNILTRFVISFRNSENFNEFKAYVSSLYCFNNSNEDNIDNYKIYIKKQDYDNYIKPLIHHNKITMTIYFNIYSINSKLV